MTLLRRLGCAAVLSAAGLVPTVAGSAHAESQTVVDGAGNASLVSFEKRQVVTRPAPAEKQSDIVDAKVDYRRQFLLVTARVSELRKYNGTNVSITLRVKGGGQDILFSRGARGALFGFVVNDENPEGAQPCAGGRVKTNVEQAVYRIRVPAGCFGAPQRIRVGFNLIRGNANDTFFADDLNGRRVSPDFDRARLGAPLKRG